jgi:MFS family permease
VSGAAVAQRGGLLVGLLLAVTLNASAALAVVTIAPRIPADLGRLDLYGWLFSAYLLASLGGNVWGGAAADRYGLRNPFALALALFVVGTLLAAWGPGMQLVILARVLQGFAGGVLTICVYVAVTAAFPDAERARVLAYLSSAWVLPALIGPALAGLLAEVAGWRAVFLALVPVALTVALLTLPRLPSAAAAGAGGAGRPPVWALLAVVMGFGGLLMALGGITGEVAPPWPLPAVLAGVLLGGAAGFFGLRQLLPPGTLRARTPLGRVVASRLGFFAAFIGVEAYLALMLTDHLGLSSAATGGVIALGAIGWSAGAWWAARRDAAGARRVGRGARLLAGVLALGAGLALQLLVLLFALPFPVLLATFGWMVAGLGIGTAHSTSSVLAFALAEADGFPAGGVSTALQLADNLGAGLIAGLAGAALGWVTLGVGAGEEGLRVGLIAAYAVAAGAWWWSVAVAFRGAGRA